METSLRFMSLKALGVGMRGIAHGHFGLRPSGGPLGLPGDFLIAPSGQIKAAKYGTHAYDQWSVDELIALAKGAARQAACKEPPLSSKETHKSGQIANRLEPIAEFRLF